MNETSNFELHGYMIEMNIAAYLHRAPDNDKQVRTMARRFRKQAKTVIARSVLKKVSHSTLPSELVKRCYEEYTKIN